MSQLDPGLDRSDWEAAWQALEDSLRDGPAETLPEVDDLVTSMLLESGIAIDDAVAREGIEPELRTEWEQAHETAMRIDAGEPVDPGDIAAAVEGFRALYRHLTEDREGAA